MQKTNHSINCYFLYLNSLMSCASRNLSSLILLILVYFLTWLKSFSLSLSLTLFLTFMITFYDRMNKDNLIFWFLIWINQYFRFKDSFISKLAKRDHIIHVIFEWPSLLKVKQHWFKNSKEHDSTWQKRTQRDKRGLNNITLRKTLIDLTKSEDSTIEKDST